MFNIESHSEWDLRYVIGEFDNRMFGRNCSRSCGCRTASQEELIAASAHPQWEDIPLFNANAILQPKNPKKMFSLQELAQRQVSQHIVRSYGSHYAYNYYSSSVFPNGNFCVFNGQIITPKLPVTPYHYNDYCRLFNQLLPYLPVSLIRRVIPKISARLSFEYQMIQDVDLFDDYDEKYGLSLYNLEPVTIVITQH